MNDTQKNATTIALATALVVAVGGTVAAVILGQLPASALVTLVAGLLAYLAKSPVQG